FGLTYIVEGRAIRTNDLSLTFHMVRYVPHLVRWWPRLIRALLDTKDCPYPQGWLQPPSKAHPQGTMTDHNNYDVVELFHRGWRHMDRAQREPASYAVAEMLAWCMENSVGENGVLKDPDKGDPIADSYYFAAAFLETIGFFDFAEEILDRPFDLRR